MKKKTIDFWLKRGAAAAAAVGLPAALLYILSQYPVIAEFAVLAGIAVGFVIYCRYILADETAAGTYPLMEVTVCTGGESKHIDGVYIEKPYVTVGISENSDIVIHGAEQFGDVLFCIEKKGELYYIRTLNIAVRMYKIKKNSLSEMRDEVPLYTRAGQNLFRIRGKNEDDYMDIQIKLH